MASGPYVAVNSATPTPANGFRKQQQRHRGSSRDEEEAYTFGEGLAPPKVGKEARSISNASLFGPRTASLANSVAAPGSFSSNLKMTPRTATRPEFTVYQTSEGRPEEVITSERRQADYRDKINKEMKIKIGSENLLEALLSKNSKQTKDQRNKVESELTSSNKKIAELEFQLQEEIERSKRPSTPFRSRLSSIFYGSPLRSPSRQSNDNDDPELEEDEEVESPTFVLGEILQALEVEGMQPDYYVLRANGLVDLFKRHPTLKYDLAWSIFGLRVQMMLLSDSREVIAAGYRVTRHAIADRKSLQKIRTLHADEVSVLSLAKDNKAAIEREQALKFIRAFLDVKDGAQELSNAVARAVVSVAEHFEDRLRNIAVLTLTELLIKNPELLVRAGGVVPLAEALRDGHYPGSESLVSAFLYLTDTPQLRKYVLSGQELQGPFALFLDVSSSHNYEERLKTNARSVSATINSWPGLFALSRTGFASLASLMYGLSHQNNFTRSLVLDLLFDILHIKPPSWTSSFLAGRRLTTYGRVAALRVETMENQTKLENEDDLSRANLVAHYTALVLLILSNCGLIEALSELCADNEDPALNRKATLLLSEILKLADHVLPQSISARLQTLPAAAIQESQADETFEGGLIGSDMAYQLDSVSRTLNRTAIRKSVTIAKNGTVESSGVAKESKAGKPKLSVDMDEVSFRAMIIDTHVINSSNYLKWKWDIITDIIEGPLQNPRRFEEARASKFIKRLMGFYRPFKYRFSDVRNTKPNQRYVRAGCALVKSLLKHPEGVSFLQENKLLRQLAECVAQLDRVSGITSAAPLFSRQRISETLTGGYFNILGALSTNQQGLVMLARWRMHNMFYHIIDLRDRDEVVQLLLGNMDFTFESHLRVILSKALTSCSKSIRIFATKLLRQYATQEVVSGTVGTSTLSVAHWAIRFLVTQLYDPEVEVSEVAVQILQESCNQKSYLEYVVQCRPELDHLGEIGAPLLLRFLSTSLGYRYLHGLDYITQEMDDWFLGRNEKYVTLVESSLGRAFSYETERPKSFLDEPFERQMLGIVPPHFYRELMRTDEGCKLLEESGHFEEFVSTIKDFWSEDGDAETMLKVKGCLWAVGNVGSMDLGAPFLERSNVVQWIVRIVERSAVLTMRGTAFFVLGLISRSVHGMEMLADRGWDVATNHLGQSVGYVLPSSLDKLFKIEPIMAPQPASQPASPADMPPCANEQDPYEQRIYTSAIESGNTVLSRRALNSLNDIKQRRPELFRSVAVFRRIMHILQCHTVRLPVRQRITGMFSGDVVRRIVLEEASDDEDDDGDGGGGEDGADEKEDRSDDGQDRADGDDGEGDDDSDGDGEESQPNTARPLLTSRTSYGVAT